MIKLLIPLFSLIFLFSFRSGENIRASASHVKIIASKNSYTLQVNGKPYYIKGAGGYVYFDKLKEYGGNSVRLWSTDGAKAYLDKAHALGLTVTLGLEMGLERRGFNYSDKAAVKKQYEQLQKEILEFKDHPALLMWGVGNELDQWAQNYEAWDAVNDVAEYIHKVDPHHPTTTMLAGVSHQHVREIAKRARHIDILSINSFLDLPNVRAKITEAGWNGPYVIGEWGATGYWESPKVPWGTFLEDTSTEKARIFKENYTKAILANKDRCLGSYVFYWGYKQARTHTLLSLYLEGGEETEMIDVLQTLWSGKAPENKAPSIVPIGIDDRKTHEGVYLVPDSDHMAYTEAKDPDQDPLTFFWEIYFESSEKKEGGDREDKPQPVEGLIREGKGRSLSFKAPSKEGAYRLYVTVYDGHNNVATANAPFFVRK